MADRTDVISLVNRDLKSICRLCLGDGYSSTLNDVSRFDDKVWTLRQKIYDSTSIQIKEGDPLPSKVCEDCCEAVEKIISFKQRCLLSEVLLQKHVCCLSKAHHQEVENVAATADSSSEYEFSASDSDDNVEDDSAIPDAQPASPEPSPSPPVDVEVQVDINFEKVAERAENADANKSRVNAVSPRQRRSVCLRKNPRPSTKGRVLSQTREQNNLQKQKNKDRNLRHNSIGGHYLRSKGSIRNKKACEVCHREFSKMFSLRRHMLTHTDFYLKCTTCDKTFKSMESLARHEKLHTNSKPYGCEVCGKSYLNSSAYAAHIRKHTGERPYECTQCGEKFQLVSSFDRHVAKHKGEREFVCEICHASFWVNHDLRAHVNRRH